MNPGNDYCRELAESIQSIFAIGFCADADTVHFINSTLGHPDHRQLESVLNDANNCDRDGLIDLIVSPDATVYCQMEEFLMRASFTGQDIQAIRSLLPDALQTSVRVPEMTETVFFMVPVYCQRRFLSQLKLAQAIDPDIRDAIETCLSKRPDRLSALVSIRHSRSVLDGTRKKTLLKYFSQSNHLDNDRRLLHLKIILDLLARQKKDKEVYNLFETEKQNCLKQVGDHRRLTEKLTKNNMETLMLQGCRIGLSADIPMLLQKINSIDEITRIIWGQTPVTDASDLQDMNAMSILFEKERPR